MAKELPSISGELKDPRSSWLLVILEQTAGCYTPAQLLKILEWMDEWEEEKAAEIKAGEPPHLIGVPSKPRV